MEKHGYAVIQARDGQREIELARQEKPTLILLDIQLPGMDSYAVISKLRRSPTLDDVSITAITSYAMAGDRERVLAIGFTG